MLKLLALQSVGLLAMLIVSGANGQNAVQAPQTQRGAQVNPPAPPANRVSSFTPTGMTESNTQVRATFSTDMVPVTSAYEAADVFNFTCAPAQTGSATWANQRTLTFNFRGRSLPPGTECRFTLKPNVRNLAGRPVAPATFNFKVDGPGLRRVVPQSSSQESTSSINEDQVFILVSEYDLDIESVRRNLRFVNTARGSASGFQFVSPETRAAILRANDMTEPSETDEKRVLVIQPTEKFPNGTRVQLVWGKGIRIVGANSGRESDLIHRYEVRQALRADFTCTRENPRAGCNPLLEMEVRFSSLISTLTAAQIVLVDSKGNRYPSNIVEPRANTTIQNVVFKGPFPVNERFQVVLPQRIIDDAQRPLANASSYPLTVTTSNFPPLAKFAADFGIVEANDQPVLPVSVRNIEAQAMAALLGAGSSASVDQSATTVSGEDFTKVVNWLKRIDYASRDEYESRKKSVFTPAELTQAQLSKIPVIEGGRPLQTVGIPLPRKGLHIVELNSRLLGNSLLGANQPMFVSTAALATNLSVHLKWGSENSIAWVTELHSGRPAANVKVSLASCTGQILFNGETNGNGIAALPSQIINQLGGIRCEPSTKMVNGKEVREYSKYDNGFFVVASKGDDFSFAHSKWNDGIEAYNFGIYNEHPSSKSSSMTGVIVLDRSLLRAGEKASMKLYARGRSGRGFTQIPVNQLPKSVKISR